MQALDDELEQVLGRLQNQHEIAPFLQGWHSVEEMRLRLMSPAIHTVLRSSPDFREPDPGVGPVWLQISSEGGAAELVVYRALADRNLYVLVPSRQMASGANEA